MGILKNDHMKFGWNSGVRSRGEIKGEEMRVDLIKIHKILKKVLNNRLKKRKENGRHWVKEL